MKNLYNKKLWLTNWALNNKTAVYIITLLLILGGILAYKQLPKEAFPEIRVPTVVITTIYPGNSPTEIDNLITRELEKELKSLNGVKKIVSSSLQDFSMIRVEFFTNINPDKALQDVKDAVDKAKSNLPDDLPKDPEVKDINFAEIPIMFLNIAGNYSMDRLKDYAEKLQDELETIPEITRVDMVGAMEREVQVNIDPYKLDAYNISINEVINAIARENMKISAGEIKTGDFRRTVRIDGEFKSPLEIENIVIRNEFGSPVFLKDVATVLYTYKERESYARLNGKQVITLLVIKKAGENLISAYEKTQEKIQKLQKTYFPEDLEIKVTNNMYDRTNSLLTNLFNSIIIGFILVVVVLMFFIGLVNASFVGIAVPLSALLTFVMLNFMHIEVNMVVLFSLLVAVGILVDTSVVVVENIYRIYKTEGLPLKQAANYGSWEVFLPILAGVATNVAPFFPLLFWNSTIGEFMKYIPITLLIIFSASTFIAFFLNPVFISDFMHLDEKESDEPIWKQKYVWALAFVMILFYIVGFNIGANFILILLGIIIFYSLLLKRMIWNFQNRAVPRISNGYAKLIEKILTVRRATAVLSVTIILLVGVVMLLKLFPLHVIFFPDPQPKQIEIYVKLPEGSDVEYTNRITLEIEKKIWQVLGKNNPDIDAIVSNVSVGANRPMELAPPKQPQKSKITIVFKEYKERKYKNTRDYIPKLKEAMSNIVGAEITVEGQQAGPPRGKPVTIELKSDDYDALIKTALFVQNYLDSLNIPGVEELRSDLEIHKPELRIVIDREKARREGLSTAQIGGFLRNILFGKEAEYFKDGDDDIPIVVRYDEKYRNNIEVLLNSKIKFMDMSRGRKRQIPVASLVKFQLEETLGKVNKRDQRLVVTLSSNVLPGYTPDVINKTIEAELTKLLANNDKVKFSFGGEQEDQKEAQQFLSMAFLVSIGLILLILILLFNSIGRTFLILAQIVFSIIGILLGFIITRQPITVVMVGVGTIALAGIVINNGILLIEFADMLYKEQGVPYRKAIIEAARIRLNPVLLTATSTILGMIPMAIGFNIDFIGLLESFSPNIYFGGYNSEFWRPLAWTFIYGLTFATVLTLLVLPSTFYLYVNLKKKLGISDYKI